MSGIGKLVFISPGSSPLTVSSAVKFRNSNELSLKRVSADAAESEGAVYVSDLPYIMEISAMPRISLTDQVMQSVESKLAQAEACIKSINGVEPTGSSGAVFINPGDKCMNWTPDTGLDPNGYPKEDGTEDQRKGVSYNTHGIYIFDTCPPCENSCSKLATMKLILEQYKLLAWKLKDINLYTKSTTLMRNSWAAGYSMALPASCQADSVTNATDPHRVEFDMDMDRVLGQYMTLVHMWNYLVQNVPSATEFHPLPEDVSGFAVQTGYARMTCDGNTDIECQIYIEPVSVQENLVTFMPQPSAALAPGFDIPLNPSWTFTPGENNIGGTWQFNHNSGTTVGTYLVTLKLYPYIPVIQYRSDDPDKTPLNISDYMADSIPERTVTARGDGTYSVVYSGTGISTEIQTSGVTPSLANYVMSKNYIGDATLAKNIWHVRISWILSGSMNTSHVENYYYETPGVRIPIPMSKSSISFVTKGLGGFTETPPASEPAQDSANSGNSDSPSGSSEGSSPTPTDPTDVIAF